MSKTDTGPLAQLDRFKRTKIIATVGPSTMSEEAILKMVEGGVNGFRLNFSHGTHEEKEQQIKWIRKASKHHDIPVAIIQDLQGPKIRCGDFPEDIHLHKNQEITYKFKGDFEEDGVIPTQYDLSKKVKRGERVLLFDGKIHTIVTTVGKDYVRAKVLNPGVISKRKGINLPDTDFEGDVITQKDRKDIVWGAHNDIDYVALSFVQSDQDVKYLKKQLKNYGSKAKIIAKIETKAATENIDEIIAVSDAVMVARGDLAIETSPESVPVLARQIIGKCLSKRKISIVATQMLASMTDNIEPTRAEASDVATAVIVGADSVMLSEETAAGKHPFEAIKVMKKIILHTQDNLPLKPVFFDESEDDTPQAAVSSAIISLAHQLNAAAIVTETKTGLTALSISSGRPSLPILKVTADETVAQQLAIAYGGKTFVRESDEHATARLTDWLREKRVFKKGDIIITAKDQYPDKVVKTDTIKVRVFE